MKKYIPLLLAAFAVFSVLYSFSHSQGSATILFFDVNIWVYRAFWLLIGVFMLYKFFSTPKEIEEKN